MSAFAGWLIRRYGKRQALRIATVIGWVGTAMFGIGALALAAGIVAAFAKGIA
jgi:hypothetical protein